MQHRLDQDILFMQANLSAAMHLHIGSIPQRVLATSESMLRAVEDPLLVVQLNKPEKIDP